MAPLTRAQIEARKLAVLQAATCLINPVPLHSAMPRDVEKAVTDAVKVARQMLQKIDSEMEKEITG
jgi:hypothetical protein